MKRQCSSVGEKKNGVEVLVKIEKGQLKSSRKWKRELIRTPRRIPRAELGDLAGDHPHCMMGGLPINNISSPAVEVETAEG